MNKATDTGRGTAVQDGAEPLGAWSNRTPNERAILLAHALDQLSRLFDRLDPAHSELPTPCASWTLRQLAEHVVDEILRFAESTTVGRRGQSDPDPLGDDWPGSFESAASKLLAAWSRPGAFARPHRLPGMEIPAGLALGQQLTELTMHGWDLAITLGRTADLDPVLADAALEWATQYIPPEARGAEADGYQIGPERPAAPGASSYDRLAAFCGRRVPAQGSKPAR